VKTAQNDQTHADEFLVYVLAFAEPQHASSEFGETITPERNEEVPRQLFHNPVSFRINSTPKRLVR
jgi:hypothetical protein